MIFVIIIYALLVYFVFFKFRWLPLNVFTRSFIILVGVVLSLGFFIALKLLTPATTNASITARIVEISPQVSGRIDRILVERNQMVEAGAPLFTIDPTAYRAKVDELEANLKLSSLRLQQYEDLAEADAT